MRKRHRTKIPGIYFREDSQGLRRYIVWYEDALGKGRTETLPLGSTMEDAKVRQAQLRSRKAAGERILPSKITIGDLLDEWLDRRQDSVTPGTMTVYKWGAKRAKQDIGKMKLADLTPDTLVALRQKWGREGYKKHTISKVEGPLRMALQGAARDGLIASNPYSRLLSHERVKADQRQMRCLSPEEIEKLLAHSGEWKPLGNLRRRRVSSIRMRRSINR